MTIHNDTTPNHLITRQMEITNQCNAILANAEREERDLTTEEGASIDELYAAFNSIKTQIATYERVSSMSQAYQGTGRKTTPDEMKGSSSLRAWGYGGSYNRDSKFKNLFPSADGNMHGFRDAQDWFKSVFGALTGSFDPRLTNAGGSSTGEGASGGFYMPQPVVGGLLDATFVASTFLGRVKVVPVTSKSTTFPRFEQADRSVGLIGGFEGRWIGEGLASTDQKAKCAALNATTNKLAIFTKATSELVSDSPLWLSEFEPALARAAAYSLDEAIARGTGVGMPLGLLNDNAAVTVAAEGGQAADTFNFINASKMFAAMYPGGIARAVWAVHPSVLPVLIQMPFVVKNVAASENVGGNAAVTVSPDGSLTLLGRPVLRSEHLANIGDLGDIVLVDLSQYGLFLRREMYLETSNAVFWSTDELAYRLITRLTGLGLWEGIGQRPNSGGNDSWLVKLAAR